jgi:hypothetical protein
MSKALSVLVQICFVLASQGDQVYAPGGSLYARPNMQAPYYVRGIEVHDWETDMDDAG